MLNGLALFAGYGGLELGIDAAYNGVRTVGYVERESYAATALVARMEEQSLHPAPIWDDVTTFDGRPWRGVVDIISAGFPCQPVSVIGKRRGAEDERWLWDDIERIVREVCPRWFVGENVSGLVRNGLETVLRSLAALGYDVSWGAFRAEQVGASHRRERVFMLAFRSMDGVPGLRRLSVQHTPDARLRLPVRADRSLGRNMGSDPIRTDGDDGEDLADARRELLEGRHGRGHKGNGQRWSAGRPLFAPAAADVDLWARVLAESPTFEPSFCRMADGAAERMDYRQDRLRACGNGVVPLQAAVAIRVLADRAGWSLT